MTNRFRIETQNGRHIVCGSILPHSMVKPGQVWQGSGGSTVTVESVVGMWVKYSWLERGNVVTHEKDNFSFQCRYCLVVDRPEMLKDIVLEVDNVAD